MISNSGESIFRRLDFISDQRPHRHEERAFFELSVKRFIPRIRLQHSPNLTSLESLNCQRGLRTYIAITRNVVREEAKVTRHVVIGASIGIQIAVGIKCSHFIALMNRIHCLAIRFNCSLIVMVVILHIMLLYRSCRRSSFIRGYNIHNRSLPQQTPTRHSGDNDLEIGVGRVYWLFALQRGSSQIMRYIDGHFLRFLR